MSLRDDNCDTQCSIPSLSVSQADETLCSLPSLSISTSIDDSIPSLSVSSAKDMSVEDTISLPTTSSDETTAAEASRSSSSNDFVSNIEEEMLKVSIDKANIDHTTEDYPIANQSNHVPNLHTAHRPEERAASASHRLLSEADNKLLSCPLELPTYKDDNTFPSSKTKKIDVSREVSKKQVTVSTCGTQVQVKNTNERGVQAVVSKAAGNCVDERPVEKRVSFISNIETTEDDKSHKLSNKDEPLYNEPLYKVLSVSPKQRNKTTKNTDNITRQANLELKSNTARSLVNAQHIPSAHQAYTTTAEKEPDSNKHNQVTSTRHTNFSSPYSFASRKESSIWPSKQVSHQRHDEDNEIQTNSIMKPLTNTTHATALPEDNQEYNTKLSSLEDELNCIRKVRVCTSLSIQ